jgi:hypothetical protein
MGWYRNGAAAVAIVFADLGKVGLERRGNVMRMGGGTEPESREQRGLICKMFQQL